MVGLLAFIGLDMIIPILVALVAFAVLILIHELGHFFAAKAVGVRVERLSIGFGRRVAGFTWRGTEYRVSAIPCGGYVKLYGEMEGGREDEGAPTSGDPESFQNQPAWKRALVLISGSAVNFLFAVPLLTCTYLIGLDVVEPKVGTPLSAGSPFHEAGLRPGDVVLAVHEVPVESFQRLKEELVLHAKRPTIGLRVARDGEELYLSVKPNGQVTAEGEPYPFVNVVGEFAKSSEAKDAGLEIGDRILSVMKAGADEPAIDPVTSGTWHEQFSRLVQDSPKAVLRFLVERTTETGGTETESIDVPVRAVAEWMTGVEPIPSATLGSVTRGSPAARAGLKKGDRIIRVNDQPVSDLAALAETIRRSAGTELTLTVDRGDESRELTVIPRASEEDPAVGRIGVVWSELPRAMAPLPDSPAQRAGIQPGDIPLMFNKTRIREWKDFVLAVRSADGSPASLKVKRGLEIIELSVTPEKRETGEIGLGLKPAQHFVRYGLAGAFVNGVKETLDSAWRTYRFVGKLATGQVSSKYFVGPVGIIHIVTFQAREGASQLFHFVAFITVNLAILNLLPLPILDGGGLLFLAVEKAMGRKLPLSVQIGLQYVGLFLLLALMVLATRNDLFNFVLGR